MRHSKKSKLRLLRRICDAGQDIYTEGEHITFSYISLVFSQYPKMHKYQKHIQFLFINICKAHHLKHFLRTIFLVNNHLQFGRIRNHTLFRKMTFFIFYFI